LGTLIRHAPLFGPPPHPAASLGIPVIGPPLGTAPMILARDPAWGREGPLAARLGAVL